MFIDRKSGSRLAFQRSAVVELETLRSDGARVRWVVQCYKHAAPPEQRQVRQNVSLRKSVMFAECEVDKPS
jgi:hypothetical protein